MKSKKTNIKTIYKWLISDKGKKYAFFIFYIFFFIFIFIFLAFTNSYNDEINQEDIKKEEVVSSLPFNLSDLENKSYTFYYEIITSKGNKEYLGKKQKNLITISNDVGVYEYVYRNGKIINNLEIDEFYQLFDIYSIKQIIKNSKYEYKQEYNDGRIYYSYIIKNGELSNYLDVETIKSELDNEILIETNNENKVKKITFNILNFINNSSTLNQKDTLYKIIITYGDTNE